MIENLSLNSRLPFGLKYTGYQPLKHVIITPTDPIEITRASILINTVMDKISHSLKN